MRSRSPISSQSSAEAGGRPQHAAVPGRAPANNVLLTGSRGTGKSSLVKAMLAQVHEKGCGSIEVDKADLSICPNRGPARRRAARFIVFCDDLTFDAGEPGYKALKVMLDGSIAGAVDEHRHLCDVEPPAPAAGIFRREPRDEACRRGSAPGRIGRGKDLAVRALRTVDLVLSVRAGRLPRGGRSGSRISASRRPAGARGRERTREALQFALQRGSRSGRVAWQFARHWAGGLGLNAGKSLSDRAWFGSPRR